MTLPPSFSFFRSFARALGVRANVAIALVVLSGCGDDAGSTGGTGAAGGTSGAGGEPPIITELFPEAPPIGGASECKVVISENLPLEGASHLEVCTEVAYGTNPPSSGNHWSIWARFGEHPSPVPHEMLVHDLEHGAVVLLYRDAGVTAAVDALRAVFDGYGADDLCDGESNRLILAPDPELEVPLAMAAWRATYTATCVDAPSLEAFVRDHYAKGPENLCAPGADPLTDPRIIACF
jgi:hypothetical protein